jgi:protein arginine kinase activator
MLLQVHGSAKHKGKHYSRREAALMAGEDVEKLRTELSDAIAREEFELAALLRDRLRGLSQAN